jgi:hypothetical protein
MILNKVLLLALAMLSLVAGSPGTVRNKRKLDKKSHLVPSKPPLSVKRMKGEDGAPDELEIDVRVITCEKGSDECNKVKEAGGEVTKEEFVKKLADGMLGKLEKDDENGHRNLDYYCDYYYWCDCCYCYLYYDCYEW